MREQAAVAEAVCAERGLRFTPIRRRVLEILSESHSAIGAYEVLERLKAEGFGGHPPVAYRALDFLVENGFAHKLERSNAFVACVAPEGGHRPMFLVCRNCAAVAEAEVASVTAAVAQTASALGFQVEATAIEAEGLCPACQESGP